MKWKLYIAILLASGFVLSLIFSKPDLYLALNNSTDKEFLYAYVELRNHKPTGYKVEKSMFPVEFHQYDTKVGFNRIMIDCPDLNISENIWIFTLYKNIVDIEFTTGLDDQPVILIRKSWFRLTYM